jgi:hypothetical protein
MLSQNERRRLRDMELRLTAECPRLAAALRDGRPPRMPWWWVTLGLTGLMLCLLGFVTGSGVLALGGLTLGVTAFTLAWWCTTPRWRDEAPR